MTYTDFRGSVIEGPVRRRWVGPVFLRRRALPALMVWRRTKFSLRQFTAALALLLFLQPGSAAAADIGAGLLWKHCTGSAIRACQLFIAEVVEELEWPEIAWKTLPMGVVPHHCPTKQNHKWYWETYIKVFVEYWGSAPEGTWSSGKEAVTEAMEDAFPHCANQRIS